MKQTIQKLSPKHLFATISATLVVSSGLIVSTIGKWSVWHDEGYSVMLTQYPVRELLRRAALDVHPPLYYLILKAWGSVFGWSAVALRSYSAVLGLVAIALALLVCHKLFGRKTTLLLAPMLAVAPVITRYSQETRMYTLAMVLCLGVVYSYIKLKEAPATKLWRVVFVALSAALIYTHYFASLILAVPLLNELWELRGRSVNVWIGRFKYIAPLYLGILALVLPWLPKLLGQVGSVSGGFWIGPVTASSLVSTISSFILFRPEWLAWRLMGGYAVLAMIMMVVVVVLSKKASGAGTLNSRMVVLTWITPMVFLYGISAFNYNFYYDRYFSSFAPFFFMTLALGLGRLRIRYAMMSGAVLVSLLSWGIYNVTVYGNNYGHDKGDEFSMKQIYEHVSHSPYASSKYVATDLGVYYDLRSYLVADGKDEPFMLVEKPGQALGEHGNTSLVYDRSDILLNDMSTLQNELPAGSYVWYLTHKNYDPADRVPTSWTKVDSFQNGYAQANLYRM